MNERHNRLLLLLPAFLTLGIGASACNFTHCEAAPVKAKVAATHVGSLAVTLINGDRVKLVNGTRVSAECQDGQPLDLLVVIDSGKYVGYAAINVPSTDLMSTARAENPFLSLDNC
jgi:predicted rRNA methylase YqxC with S4 and FtsJ domains